MNIVISVTIPGIIYVSVYAFRQEVYDRMDDESVAHKVDSTLYGSVPDKEDYIERVYAINHNGVVTRADGSVNITRHGTEEKPLSSLYTLAYTTLLVREHLYDPNIEMSLFVTPASLLFATDDPLVSGTISDPLIVSTMRNLSVKALTTLSTLFSRISGWRDEVRNERVHMDPSNWMGFECVLLANDAMFEITEESRFFKPVSPRVVVLDMLTSTYESGGYEIANVAVIKPSADVAKFPVPGNMTSLYQPGLYRIVNDAVTQAKTADTGDIQLVTITDSTYVTCETVNFMVDRPMFVKKLADCVKHNDTDADMIYKLFN